MPVQFQIHATIQPHTECVIIPVSHSDNLTPLLEKVAKTFGVPLNLLQRDFKADYKEVCAFYHALSTTEVRKVYLLGLGKHTGATEVLKAMRNFMFQHQAKLPVQIGIDLTIQGLQASPHVVEALLTGALLGGYDLKLYHTEKPSPTGFFATNAVLELYVNEENKASIEQIIQKSQATADTLKRVMDLGNAPGNYKNPQTLAQWAIESGTQYGYQVTVFGKEQLAEMGMHALLAVNKGSAVPPALIVMEYKGTALPQGPKVGLVGKGVTFDTGGISLKDSANMHLMKSDMGGAAAVLGTLELAARLQLPVHLVGVIPSTENCVDGASTKPGDVISSYAGKTIEVIDTDAEGRLILADALSYITQHYQPEVVIDLATLTGSVIGTLGYVAAGLFSNNDTLAADLLAASEETGEKLWRLPLWDDYKEDLKSDVADVKNYHGKPFAGAIMGAKFLEVFINHHANWAHLDIAAMAFMESEFGSQKNATGYGVRLLLAYLTRQSGK